MRNSSPRALAPILADQRGNVAVLFAAAAIPLIGLLGGAVDLARHARYEAQIASTLDAAALALVRRGAKSDAEADRFVNDFIAARDPHLAAADSGKARGPGPAGRDPMLHLARFDATAIPGGYRVASAGYMDTAFMPLVGIETLRLDLEAEVMGATGRYEVALALDNTGSMRERGRIEALRGAASALVDDLYSEDGAAERVRMALIPFVTAVNIKTPGVYREAEWIEPAGDPEIYGQAFSRPADRLKLFRQMGVAFKGCVEARAGHDEDDAAPVDAATRWVPYLWPDEPDGWANSYLEDIGGGDPWDRLRNVDKYVPRQGRPVADTTGAGPNAACPRPIVELTADTGRLQDEIRRMKPHNVSGGNHSGTNVAEGLAWAWRVLSPGEPYSQGAAYADRQTTKVLVLLSDGRNQIVPNARVTRSDYTSHGYLAAGRLGTRTDYLKAEREVDAKVGRLCAAVKARGIRLYTILFEVDFPATQALFQDCASTDAEGRPLFFYVPDASELETAFQEIGKDLTRIHVSR